MVPRRPRRPKVMPIKIGDEVKEVVVFNVGYLAYVIGKTPATVRAWERDGILPRTPFTVGGKSERVYTDTMVTAVKEAIDAQGGHVSKGDEMFYRSIVGKWQSLGIKVG